MGKDYYKILGIEKSAGPDEIKQSFRKKAHQYHPDKAGGDAEKFKEINEAYQILGNAEKRKQYDQFGTTFENMGGQRAYDAGFDWTQFFRQGGQGRGNYGGFNFDFGDLGDIFDLFGSSQSRGSRRRSTQSRGADLETNLTLTFREAVFGAEKILELAKQIICHNCQGNGAEPGSKTITCKTCSGSGQITITQQTFFGAFRSSEVCTNCGGDGRIAEKKCGQCRGLAF